MLDGLLLTPEAMKEAIREGYEAYNRVTPWWKQNDGDRFNTAYKFIAEAAVAKIQPVIDTLKEESEARREIINRLTTRLEVVLKHRLDRPELREEINDYLMRTYGQFFEAKHCTNMYREVDQILVLIPTEEEIKATT